MSEQINVTNTFSPFFQDVPFLRVLLVEDNPDHVEIIQRAVRISDAPLRLYTAGSFGEGLAFLQKEPVDIILSDLRLPDGSGLDFLKTGSPQAGLPVVIITNQGSETHAAGAVKNGAVDYIVKSPENLRQMPYIIQRCYTEWKTRREKEQSELALREHQRRLAHIYQVAPVGLGLFNESGLIECNDRVYQMFGYRKEETPPPYSLEQMLSFIVEEVDAEALRSALRRENLIHFETDMRRRDGSTFRAAISLTRVQPSDDNLFVFAIQDITLQFRAVRELERKEQDLLALKAQLQDKIRFLSLIKDIQAVLLAQNEPGRLLAGLIEHFCQLLEILGGAFFHPNDHKVGFQWFDQCARETPAPVELDGLRAGLQNTIEEMLRENRITAVSELYDAPSGERFSALLLKLHNSQELIGFLIFLSRTQRFFESEWHDYAESLARQINLALEKIHLIQRLQAKQRELEQSYDNLFLIWSRTLDMRDQPTSRHTERVTQVAVRLAAAIGLEGEALKRFEQSALLHDIGKIRIPDQILYKPGGLSEEEWQIMRQHPLYAAEMLTGIKELEWVMEIPLYHHERWDGSGYPFGLKGEQIPLAARIFAVADVWDALTSDRPYRPAWTRSAARQYLLENRAKLFDPRVVDVFVQLLDNGELEIS